MLKPFSLRGPVDSAASVREQDTLQTKLALQALGHYKAPSYGITPYPDKPMFNGIKSFQRANKLHVDGVMKPDGETERMMNFQLSTGATESKTGNTETGESGSDETGKTSGGQNTNPSVITPPNVDPKMPTIKEPFFPNSDPYIDEHGNIILEGVNPKTGRPVRPPKET